MSKGLDIKSIRANRTVTAQGTPEQATLKPGIWEFLNKDIQWGGKGLSDRVKEHFYLELQTLLDAGIDIRTALELIRDEQKKKRNKDIFDTILKDVVTGAALSAAMQKTKQFSNYEYVSVRIGEESGKLTRVLKEMTIFFQKRIKQRRQIMGAMSYPIVVMVIAFSAVFFMISYVVPMFSDVFRRFGNDLPAVTKLVISVSDLFKHYAGLFVLVLSAVVALIIWQRQKEWYRRFSSKVIMRIPVINILLQKIYLAQFANTMALLTGARIPIVQAIQLTRQMITFYPLQNSLLEVEQAIISGVPLFKALSAYSIYPRKMISMIKVGEEVNQLELFFVRIAGQYGNEVEHQTGMLSKVLEPLIIVVLGLVVGIILIAMYLPLFKLGQGF